MTVTFTSVEEDVPCQRPLGLENDQAIALKIEASMPPTADPEFTSPFRSFPWSTLSGSDRVTRVRSEMCNGDSSVLDLMNEFPGANAEATVYLDAPASVRAIVFEPNRTDTYLIVTE